MSSEPDLIARLEYILDAPTGPDFVYRKANLTRHDVRRCLATLSSSNAVGGELIDREQTAAAIEAIRYDEGIGKDELLAFIAHCVRNDRVVPAAAPKATEGVACSKCGEPNIMLCDCSLPTRVATSTETRPALAEERAREVLRTVAKEDGWHSIKLEADVWKTAIRAMLRFAALTNPAPVGSSQPSTSGSDVAVTQASVESAPVEGVGE